jgi:hypothetical protein
MSLMTLHCPECGEDRLFERPYPVECHGTAEQPDRAAAGTGEGTELACVECGTAVYSGFALPIMVGVPGPARARRHLPGRAA